MDTDEAKGLLGSTEILDKVLSSTSTAINAYTDVMSDYKRSNSRIYKMFGGALVTIVVMAAGFVVGFMLQQEKYLAVIQAQQKEMRAQQTEFIDFLNQYDFQTIDATQDGGGVNIVGGGDVTNGAESKDTPTDTER